MALATAKMTPEQKRERALKAVNTRWGRVRAERAELEGKVA